MTRPCHWCGVDTLLDEERDITWMWVTLYIKTTQKTYTPFAFCDGCSLELADIIKKRHEYKK